MSPQLGQGANLALLDAYVLAGCLERHGVEAALAAYSEARRAHLRFYSWASRLMTPVFQSHLGMLGPPRDLLMQPLARIPWVRRQFLGSLAGAKTGVLGTLDYAD
jgi:2-polyprenyl-6-methoxyphenol hydroxylase-like FAD-dependent oxidoreductase